MRKKALTLLTQLLIGIACMAQTSKEDCPKPPASVFSILCSQVENQAEAPEASPYNFLFEKTIENSACVDRQTDKDSVIRVKVQNWWNKYKLDCNCNRANFVLADGNLLKYAAQQNFDLFFVTIIQYKLDLNFIDPIDGKTLLDFILFEYQKALGLYPKSQKTTDLKKLHDYLRKNGALYKSELK